MPGACCTRGLACKRWCEMRTRAYRYSRSTPAFPAQWFYGLCRALPEIFALCAQDSLALDRSPPRIRFRSTRLHFPTRCTVIAYTKFSQVVGGQGVSQISCMLLLVAALMLTACFGLAAWRISGGEEDVTGSASPASFHLR